MSTIKEIEVQGSIIHLHVSTDADYICITDMANARQGDARAADIIKNWIRTRTTLEFLGTWELLHNPNFKVVEFDHFRMQAGLPSFVLSPTLWVEKTNAIGIYSKAGKYGGTYAHVDIALEFGSAISPIFKLYLIKEYKLLKNEESNQQHLKWDVHRTLAKVNYRIHTDAIKANIIPPEVDTRQQAIIYASEADVLNVAVFGITSSEWRGVYPNEKGNIRDHSTIEQLLVLANLESLNAEYITMGLSQGDRLKRLNETAIRQMKSISQHAAIKKLK